MPTKIIDFVRTPAHTQQILNFLTECCIILNWRVFYVCQVF